MPYWGPIVQPIGGQLLAQGISSAGDSLAKAITRYHADKEQQATNEVLFQDPAIQKFLTPEQKEQFFKANPDKQSGLIVGAYKRFKMSQETQQSGLDERKMAVAERGAGVAERGAAVGEREATVNEGNLGVRKVQTGLALMNAPAEQAAARAEAKLKTAQADRLANHPELAGQANPLTVNGKTIPDYAVMKDSNQIVFYGDNASIDVDAAGQPIVDEKTGMYRRKGQFYPMTKAQSDIMENYRERKKAEADAAAGTGKKNTSWLQRIFGGGGGSGSAAAAPAGQAPKSGAATYSIGTRAKTKDGVWHTMTASGWDPPLATQ